MAASGPDGAVVSLVTEAIMATIKDAHGIHLETAVAGAAATAGTFLLRSVAGDALDSMKPGAYVIYDRVNGAGPRLLGFVKSLAVAANITWDTQTLDIPPEHEPHEPYVDLVRRLEPPVAKVLTDHAVPPDQWADHTAPCAVDLLLRAGPGVPLPVASRIITMGIVNGSKTVPYTRGT